MSEFGGAAQVPPRVMMQSRARGGALSRRHGWETTMTMRSMARAAAVGLVLVVAGCGEVRSDRPLQLEPGVYKGETDEALGEEQRKALTERATHQR